ncbi:MAG: DUF6498-containing protein [Gammaproteobacteria bacterium]
MEYGSTPVTSGSYVTDRSVAWLLLSNLVTLVLALLSHWNLSGLLWIYWGQSVIIGWFNIHRILGLKRFSTEGFRINNRPVQPTRATRRQTAVFFALHYGLFHIGYLVFLLSDARMHGGVSVPGVLLCILVFYVNHRFSWRYHRACEAGRVPNIGNIMFFPYLRIIPMHLIIVLGSEFAGNSVMALVVFLLLKTVADVAMHIVEHAMARGDTLRASRELP